MNRYSAPRPQARVRRTALWLLIALIALCVAWEAVLAPLRPGGSWLVLKVLPLLVLVPGVARGDLRHMQIATLVVLLYVAEGIVRLGDGPPVTAFAVVELLLSGGFFAATVAFLAPFKRAAKQQRKQRDTLP